MNIIEKLGITSGPWYKVGKNRIMRRPESELYEYGGGVAGDMPLATTSKGFFGEDLKGYPEEGNARLIATAPEMLEALIDLINKTGELREEQVCTYNEWKAYKAIIEKATDRSWEEITELIK